MWVPSVRQTGYITAPALHQHLPARSAASRCRYGASYPAQTRIRIAQADTDFDYLNQAQHFQQSNGEFWFHYSQVLRSLPESQLMDLRPNGPIAAAVYAAEKCLVAAPYSKGANAEYILALNMLTHGLSSLLNADLMHPILAQRNETEIWFKHTFNTLKTACQKACQQFPDDEWFQTELDEVIQF